MDLKMNKKVAVIIGASKGIGFATAKAFLNEGAIVAICARNKNELEKAKETLSPYGEVYAAPIDATRMEEINNFADQVYSQYGHIDYWINNVGATLEKQGENYTNQEIDWIVDVCFKTVIYGCQAASKYMVNTGGSIVNVSSLAARCGTVGRSTLYGPLKSAVCSLSVMFAGEFAAYGIRVNSILPGFTTTPKVEESISENELLHNAENTLLRRVATPEEIAGPIVFLCSQQASYITATSLEVSGGRSVVLNPSYSYDLKISNQI